MGFLAFWLVVVPPQWDTLAAASELLPEMSGVKINYTR